MAKITNDLEMTALLVKDFEKIVDDVTKQLYKKLRESIEKIVYGAGTPNPIGGYKRNRDKGGLLGSFYKEKTKINNLSIIGEINQNPDTMIHKPEKFVHGSNYWEAGDDVREILADIVRAGMFGDGEAHVGRLFGETGFWTESRDFWQPIIDMFENGELDTMIETAMTNRGIKWIKIG